MYCQTYIPLATFVYSAANKVTSPETLAIVNWLTSLLLVHPSSNGNLLFSIDVSESTTTTIQRTRNNKKLTEEVLHITFASISLNPPQKQPNKTYSAQTHSSTGSPATHTPHSPPSASHSSPTTPQQPSNRNPLIREEIQGVIENRLIERPVISCLINICSWERPVVFDQVVLVEVGEVEGRAVSC